MSNRKQPQVVILGQGALGRTLAYLFAQSDSAPLVYSRSTHGARSYTVHDGTTTSTCSLDIKPLGTFLDHSADTTPRLIFLCAKAQGCISLSATIASVLKDNDCLVVPSNGIGVYDACKRYYPQIPLTRLAVNFGMYIPSAEVLQLHGSPAFSLVDDDRWDDASKLLRHLLSPFPTTSYPDVKTLEWNKASINYVVNSLCTLVRSTNAAVLRGPLSVLAEALYSEFCAVAAQEGVALRSHSFQLLTEQIRHFQNNTNSTLQDILHKRATELPFLMSPVLECARTHSLPMPISSLVYTLLYTLEQESNTEEHAL